jgi:predicted HTH transcriptional regulator
MGLSFKVQEDGIYNLYYVSIDKNKSFDNYMFDGDIAKLLEISLKQYQNKLLEYNAVLKPVNSCKYDNIYFKTKTDARRAIEWMKSLLLAKQLGDKSG